MNPPSNDDIDHLILEARTLERLATSLTGPLAEAARLAGVESRAMAYKAFDERDDARDLSNVLPGAHPARALAVLMALRRGGRTVGFVSDAIGDQRTEHTEELLRLMDTAQLVRLYEATRDRPFLVNLTPKAHVYLRSWDLEVTP